MKITLICPTNKYGKSATSSIYYPMGILLVGSWIKDTFPEVEVEILDGERYSLKELEQKLIGTTVLGLSANTNNYPHCLQLAERAKESGVSKVVLGGPHATAVPEQILRNQNIIDAVVVHDGEKPFLEYLVQCGRAEQDFGGITNVVWRQSNGEIKKNKIELPIKAPRLQEMNFSLMDLQPYWQEHQKEFPQMSERFLELFTHVGCTWRALSGGCKFCDIPYPVNAYVPPGQFWRDVEEAVRTLRIGSLKDYGDCLTGNPERVKALVKARPSHLKGVELSAYGRSKEITEEMADLLCELNVKYLYVGFDAGSNQMLKAMRQGYTVNSNYQATERLAQRGINVTGSLILGIDGESEKTIEETEHFAREIVQYPNLTQLYCAVLNVFPGAPYAQDLLRRFPHLADDDVWDVQETQRLWIESFCKVPREYIQAKALEINNLNPSLRQRYFGLEKLG